jgi:ADP-ribose pyrophosphatase YjhB (NUDIX family)
VPTPDFVLRLRAKIGHDMLPMSGVTGVVLDDAGRLLLNKRPNGRWSLPSGILEPGEQPAVAVVREIAEETAVEVRVVGLTSVWMQPPRAYPNGDRVQFLDLTFRCAYVAGRARVNDDESTDVGWFDLAEIPPSVSDESRAKLARALAWRGATWFQAADDRSYDATSPLGWGSGDLDCDPQQA